MRWTKKHFALILVPALLIAGGAFARNLGNDQKPVAAGKVVGSADRLADSLAERQREAASRGNARSGLPSTRTGTPQPTPTAKPKLERKTVKQATKPAAPAVRYASPTCSATYFGDSSEYQPLANGGHSSTTTRGVALWDWPFGTKVRITSVKTGRSVIAPVADRGPADWTGNCIDLLPDTWDDLGVSRSQGVQTVRYQVLR